MRIGCPCTFSSGTLYHDAGRPAFLLMNALLAKNFAVLGMTGSGKSCGVTCILSAILADHPNAHIVLLDPHNEYATAFGELAESSTSTISNFLSGCSISKRRPGCWSAAVP